MGKERKIAIEAINMIEVYMYQTGDGVVGIPRHPKEFIDWAKKKYKIKESEIPFWNYGKRKKKN